MDLLLYYNMLKYNQSDVEKDIDDIEHKINNMNR